MARLLYIKANPKPCNQSLTYIKQLCQLWIMNAYLVTIKE